jgi:RNA polymerase sigma-70 factor (ECF subfamily)
VVVPIDDAALFAPEREPALIALDAALSRLGELDPRKSAVVEMRYFAGLTVDEAAEALGVAPITVMRDWSFAKAWLKRELGDEA